MDEALALFSVQKQSPLGEGCSQHNLREHVLSRGCQVGQKAGLWVDVSHAWGTVAHPLWSPATWTHLQGFWAVVASNNQDPWPFLLLPPEPSGIKWFMGTQN